MTTEKKRPAVGVAVFVCREDGKYLVGKRKGAHASGVYALPGGHLEFGETPVAAARREVMEETNLVIRDIRKVGFTNDFYPEEDHHYVTLFYSAQCTGEAVKALKLMEPDKCEGWGWSHTDNLPTPLMPCLQQLINEWEGIETVTRDDWDNASG
jgi:8-oxo-dGTP diphosphatase